MEKMLGRVQSSYFQPALVILFVSLGACAGGGEPEAVSASVPSSVGSAEGALSEVEPNARAVGDLAELARVSQGVFDLLDEAQPSEEPPEPQQCQLRQLGCISFEPCPEDAVLRLSFGDNCRVPGTDLDLEGSITLETFETDPVVVEVSFAELALRGNPATGTFRLEAAQGSVAWTFDVTWTDTGDSLAGQGAIMADAARLTIDATVTSVRDGLSRGLSIAGLTIAHGVELPDGGEVAVTIDPAAAIPEDAVPEDINGDGQVTWADEVQRDLLLSLEVSEVGMIFLPTTPSDGRVQVYVNDPDNPLTTGCVDIDDQTVVWGACS